eukprot:CAMPEP_0197030538 /NCGR_PEP_ID=MMETSP1384-20130603/9760_1 /TAXON_ID=29189 /ORGANISM="Ammonia sp." /LENGTH=495 /DNA_ID=CAMNT_0042459915 /DNA_START=31 /DNA_END=1515 /DNA_ORIENTATION=+
MTTEWSEDVDAPIELKHRSPTLKVCIVVTISILCLLIGFAFGFWFAFEELINPAANRKSADTNSNANAHQFDINSSNLTIDDQIVIKEAEILCADKQCCRDDDTVFFLHSLSEPTPISSPSTNSSTSTCPSLSYLDCLSVHNKCVWDCHTPNLMPDALNFLRIFRGISKHDAMPFTETPNLAADEHIHLENQTMPANDINFDTNYLNYVTMDQCGTVYDHELTPDAKRREQELLQSHSDHPHTTNPHDHVNYQYQRRRIGAILGVDERSDITTWQYPYHHNLYIQLSTGVPSEYSRCSGAFISPIHILTAGHCISDGLGHFYNDFIGIVNYNAGQHEIYFDYDDVFVFSEWHYSSNWDYDIGVITIKQENTQFGYFAFGENSGIDQSWKFDVNGYPEDKGFTMQQQELFMDFAIYRDSLYTGHGDIINGNSGGPAWYTNDYTIYAVASHTVSIRQYHGVPVHPPIDIANGFTRITKPKMDAMCAYMRKFSQTQNW